MGGLGKEDNPPQQESWDLSRHPCHMCPIVQVMADVGGKPSPDSSPEETAGVQSGQGQAWSWVVCRQQLGFQLTPGAVDTAACVCIILWSIVAGALCSVPFEASLLHNILKIKSVMIFSTGLF